MDPPSIQKFQNNNENDNNTVDSLTYSSDVFDDLSSMSTSDNSLNKAPHKTNESTENTNTYGVLDDIVLYSKTWSIKNIKPTDLIISDEHEYHIVNEYRTLKKLSEDVLTKEVVQSLNNKTKILKNKLNPLEELNKTIDMLNLHNNQNTQKKKQPFWKKN